MDKESPQTAKPHDEEQRHPGALRTLTPGERLALRMQGKAQRKRKLMSPYQRRAVATVAVVHPRTVQSWERGTARSTTAARIEHAIRELDLEHVLEGRGDA